MKIDNNIYWLHKLILKERLPIWKMFSTACWPFKINNRCKRSRLQRLNIKQRRPPFSHAKHRVFTSMNYTFSRLSFRYCSKKLPTLAACASITNVDFSEWKNFHSATLQKSFVEKTTKAIFTLVAEKGFILLDSHFFVVYTSVTNFLGHLYPPPPILDRSRSS